MPMGKATYFLYALAVFLIFSSPARGADPPVNIFVLLGGLYGPDGYADSRGMLALAAKLKPYGKVSVYPWSAEPDVAEHISSLPYSNTVIMVGYSGGGSRATWVANTVSPHPIALIVAYDPSPAWQMKPLPSSVKHALQYYNSNPLLFGLGGGVMRYKDPALKVRTVTISQQHLLVQYNQTLHAMTLKVVNDAVKEASKP